MTTNHPERFLPQTTMDGYSAARTGNETGRSPGVVRIAFENHSPRQHRLKVCHLESVVPSLLIRVNGQKVLIGLDTFPDPLPRQTSRQEGSSLFLDRSSPISSTMDAIWRFRTIGPGV